MASKSLVSLLFLTLVFLGISSSWAATEENTVFYLQESFVAPNATVVTVAGLNGSSSNFSFGSISVLDDFITEGIMRSSKMLGRAQGIAANTDLGGSGFHLEFSLVFNNGSTLEIQGTAKSTSVPREFSVVGGTGRFRYARGYAMVETVASDGVNLTYKYNVTVRLD